MPKRRHDRKARSSPRNPRDGVGFGAVESPPPTPTTFDPPMPVRKPLAALPSEATSAWRWSEHAVERCAERGIGLYEVLSAIYEPDWSTPVRSDVETLKVARGDVEVVYNPRTRVIVTVVDRLNGRRDRPRTPLEPVLVSREPEPIDVPPPASQVDASAAVEPSPAVPAQRKEEEVAPARGRHPKWLTADMNGREAVRAFVEQLSDGAEFTTAELHDALDRWYTKDSLYQALRVIVTAGVARRTSVGHYVKTPVKSESKQWVSDRTYEEIASVNDPTPESAVVTTTLGGQTSSRSGRLELTDVWTEPPKIMRDQDGLQAHIKRLTDTLRAAPGQWKMVAQYPPGQHNASGRTKSLREAFTELEFVARGGAIYCRWPE